MSAAELGCSYAAMILHDDGISITGEKIATLLKASNLTVESYWPSLFAKLCEKRNVEDLIMNVGAGGGTVAAVAAPVACSAGGSAATAGPAVEEKKVLMITSVCFSMIVDSFNLWLCSIVYDS